MRKPFLVISGLIIIGILGYLAIVFLPFAEGVKEETQIKLENLSLEKEIQSGDLIFQTSRSSQSKAIQLATGSKYSHMGIIFEKGDNLYVYEAIQPVKLTPLTQWIKRGENEHFVIKRLRNSDEVLIPSTLKKMEEYGENFLGKNYDIHFEWNDDKIYCSELVWKIYKEATGIEIGKTETLSSFDLSSEAVKGKMKERYGENIPMNEKVISPKAMFESELLITILDK